MRITMHVCIIDMKHIRKREREGERDDDNEKYCG